MSALTKQEGGNHYKELVIQPIEYIHANNIPFAEGSVIKYVTRWRAKGGIKDLEKAKHFLELLIELEQQKRHQESVPCGTLTTHLQGERHVTASCSVPIADFEKNEHTPFGVVARMSVKQMERLNGIIETIEQCTGPRAPSPVMCGRWDELPTISPQDAVAAIVNSKRYMKS